MPSLPHPIFPNNLFLIKLLVWNLIRLSAQQRPQIFIMEGVQFGIIVIRTCLRLGSIQDHGHYQRLICWYLYLYHSDSTHASVARGISTNPRLYACLLDNKTKNYNICFLFYGHFYFSNISNIFFAYASIDLWKVRFERF
jgi:hypothetical protein